MRVEARELAHAYPNGNRALQGIDIVLEGDVPVAIVGQNGSGKTTFAKHLNGILRPTSGDLLIDGASIATRTTASWARVVGYVFQNPDDQLFLSSVRDELRFGPQRMGLPEGERDRIVDEMAHLCGLTDVLDEHPYDLSPTDKKFCAIGAVLSLGPRLVVLDEPTGGQDIHGRARLRELLRALRVRGVLCAAISHDMKFVAEVFARVIVFAEGRVIMDGDPHEVFLATETLARTYVSPPPAQRVAASSGLGAALTVPDLIDTILRREAVRAEKGS
ncbi:MAG: energy-coupling factor ABC transporter ATP-binding protein [Microbacterium sp.]